MLIHDAAHAADGAVDLRDLREFAAFQHRAHHGLVDDRRGPAALGDDNFTSEFHLLTCLFFT